MGRASLPTLPGVYKITCITTGSFYVGSCKNIRCRISTHYRLLQLGKHFNRHLQNAWGKYGELQFVVEVIELCNLEALIQREQYWIGQLHPSYNINLLVTKPPCNKGHTHTLDTRIKISNSHIGIRPSMDSRNKMRAAKLGKKRQPHKTETRQKIGEGNRGKKRTESERQWLSKRLKGRPPTMLGKHLTTEQCKKNGESHEKDYVVCSPMGEIFEVRNLAKFCKEHQLHAGHMSSIACGKRKKHKGWICRFAERDQ